MGETSERERDIISRCPLEEHGNKLVVDQLAGIEKTVNDSRFPDDPMALARFFSLLDPARGRSRVLESGRSYRPFRVAVPGVRTRFWQRLGSRRCIRAASVSAPEWHQGSLGPEGLVGRRIADH